MSILTENSDYSFEFLLSITLKPEIDGHVSASHLRFYKKHFKLIPGSAVNDLIPISLIQKNLVT